MVFIELTLSLRDVFSKKNAWCAREIHFFIFDKIHTVIRFQLFSDTKLMTQPMVVDGTVLLFKLNGGTFKKSRIYLPTLVL